MSQSHTGGRQPSIDAEEHDSKNMDAKKVTVLGYMSDTDQFVRLGADNEGALFSTTPAHTVLVATDSGDGNISYVGKASPGSATSSSVWQIMEVDESSGTTVKFADGDAEYNNVWDNRESLTYT